MSGMSRQMNMIRAIERGLQRAREIHGSAKNQDEWLDALADEMPLDDRDTRPMTLERAAFVAALYIAWKDEGGNKI